MASPLSSPRTVGVCVGLLLAAQAALLGWASTRHSPSNDEVGHLTAGISHWHFGRFDLYRVNPPLIRMMATLPVLPLGPKTDWSRYDTGRRPEWNIGNEFVTANGERSYWYFTVARWGCIPLVLVGGFFCFRWARDLYGPAAGLLALTLWCFCPNVLAHGQMITPDAGAAAAGVTAGYLFWRWLREPGWWRASLAGTGLGLAESTKTTWLILFALWPLLWAIYSRADRRNASRGHVLAQGAQLTVALAIGLYGINLGYGFEGTFDRLGDYQFVSEALGGDEQSASAEPEGGNRFARTWLADLPVPLPRNYVLGIDAQKRDFERGEPSYLRGEWRRDGWWYYYLYALAVKVPLGTWVLLLLAGLLAARPGGSATRWTDELVLLAPAVCVLVLVSSHTRLNLHLRYVLPAAPFVYVWAGRVARAAAASRPARLLATAAVLWSIGSSLWVYPHSLSYFNETVGGPLGGPDHLLGSNVDWGQDLLYLKRWIDEHPEARPIGLAYHGNVDPRTAGIESLPIPVGGVSDRRLIPRGLAAPGLQPGWYAVSVNELWDVDGRYEYLRRFRPVTTAGYSIYIYYLNREDADRARHELGLPPLPDSADHR